MSIGEEEFYAEVKGGQVGISLGSMHQDLGIPMKIEIQSDSSTANSLTDRLGAGQRTKHIDTQYLQRRTAQVLERSQSLLQYCNNIASLQDWYSTDHTPLQDDGGEPMMDLVKGYRPDIDTETRREYGDTSTETDRCQR